MSLNINRIKYANMFGPTTGDKVRLGDTDLIIEIEKDYTVYGDEAKFGGGKTIRDGMAQSATATRKEGVLDFVITSVMIIGASTEVHGGAGLIATAGGIDTHIHFICPQQIDHALFSGITTMIGGGN